MTRSILAMAVQLGVIVLAAPLSAADLSVQVGVPQSRNPATIYCGPCGCLQVAYVHHRELRSTYGLAFDPRNYDQTEPHFYFGPVKAYPRYFVDDVPVPNSCD